jgi:phage baseplate assembly protein W
MSVSTISSDYTGRKKDISLFQYPDASLNTTQDVAVAFGRTSRYCSGVQKLLQAYAVILLTNISSQPDYPDFGTSLMYTLKSGISPVDTIAASQIFNLASYSAVSALRAYQATVDGQPADERISRATLSDISLNGSMVNFKVTIVTEAGDAVPFLIPLPK